MGEGFRLALPFKKKKKKKSITNNSPDTVCVWGQSGESMKHLSKIWPNWNNHPDTAIYSHTAWNL